MPAIWGYRKAGAVIVFHALMVVVDVEQRSDNHLASILSQWMLRHSLGNVQPNWSDYQASRVGRKAAAGIQFGVMTCWRRVLVADLSDHNLWFCRSW